MDVAGAAAAGATSKPKGIGVSFSLHPSKKRRVGPSRIHKPLPGSIPSFQPQQGRRQGGGGGAAAAADAARLGVSNEDSAGAGAAAASRPQPSQQQRQSTQQR